MKKKKQLNSSYKKDNYEGINDFIESRIGKIKVTQTPLKNHEKTK